MNVPPILESSASVPRLVAKRRQQIADAAVKLFSEQGYYRTKILQISELAGISSGLIYQYFRNKEEVLFLTVLQVLESYMREIPAALEGVEHPLERLTKALHAYCGVVDSRRDATVLAYRSTKSLMPEQQSVIKKAELRTNDLLKQCIEDCVRDGLLEKANPMLHAYQLALFSHAWALKQWAYRDSFTLEEYVAEGERLLIEPFLTKKGWNEKGKLSQGVDRTAPA